MRLLCVTTTQKEENKNSITVKEAIVRMCSVKKLFSEILQNSQENTCARDSLLIKLQV